jgi:hypothetical protein
MTKKQELLAASKVIQADFPLAAEVLREAAGKCLSNPKPGEPEEMFDWIHWHRKSTGSSVHDGMIAWRQRRGGP